MSDKRINGGFHPIHLVPFLAFGIYIAVSFAQIWIKRSLPPGKNPFGPPVIAPVWNDVSEGAFLDWSHDGQSLFLDERSDRTNGGRSVIQLAADDGRLVAISADYTKQQSFEGNEYADEIHSFREDEHGYYAFLASAGFTFTGWTTSLDTFDRLEYWSDLGDRELPEATERMLEIDDGFLRRKLSWEESGPEHLAPEEIEEIRNGKLPQAYFLRDIRTRKVLAAVRATPPDKTAEYLPGTFSPLHNRVVVARDHASLKPGVSTDHLVAVDFDAGTALPVGRLGDVYVPHVPGLDVPVPWSKSVALTVRPKPNGEVDAGWITAIDLTTGEKHPVGSEPVFDWLGTLHPKQRKSRDGSAPSLEQITFDPSSGIVAAVTRQSWFGGFKPEVNWLHVAKLSGRTVDELAIEWMTRVRILKAATLAEGQKYARGRRWTRKRVAVSPGGKRILIQMAAAAGRIKAVYNVADLEAKAKQPAQ